MTLTQEQKSFFRNPYGDFWPFIQRIDFEREPLLLEMERHCRSLGVYSIGPWFGRLLSFLVRFGGVRSALEFGTATGYSAVWIGRGLAPDGKLVTIERNARLAALATENLTKAGLLERVDIRTGDAATVAPELEGPFDLFFVDCAHSVALQLSRRALRPGGLFVCDNVGFGYMDTFNEALMASSHLETLYLQCYLKGRSPENTAFSVSIRV
jgi:predicted O-methyltransferase YrrM